MDINSWITLVATIGGLEGIKQIAKWWLNRKNEARVNDTKADEAEFHLLQEVNIFLQQQLKQKEERFAEQTNIVREQNMQILELSKRVSILETERSMKLCERRGCGERQPQSGY